MKRKLVRSIVFGMVLASSFIICDYDHEVLAQTSEIPKNEGNIAMSYIDPITRQKMPDESEKKAIENSEKVIKDFFKAIKDKQYQTAFNYFSPEIQKNMSYDHFAGTLSKFAYINLLIYGVIGYEGNLVALRCETEEFEHLDNDKFKTSIIEYKFAVNKIGNDWRIVDMTSKDITLKYW